MRIHSLIIDNVRAVEHLELTDLPDTGVILIHGDNEAGKSTILDALDAVLTVKHDSSAAKIRALYPIGRDEQPEVTLGATIGPYTFTMHKRFGKGAKGKAELSITAPRREALTGEQAHNRLNEILAEHVDQELFDALFLRQGAFTETIEAAGIPSFTRALEASGEGGGASSGASTSSESVHEDSALMQRVEAEYSRYFTAKGNDKQILTNADKAVSVAEEAMGEAEANLESYERDVDEFAQCETAMTDIEAELPSAEEELAEREEEVAAAAELAGKLAAAQERATRAAIDVERAAEDLERRTALIARVEEVDAELAAVAEELEPARERTRVEAEALAVKEKAHEQARDKETAARENLAAAEKTLAAAQAALRLNDLADTVSRLDEADADIARLRDTVPERPVTDDDVRALESAANEVALQRRLRDATAARVDAAAPNGTIIGVDGTDHEIDEEGESIALHHGTELTIGEVTLTYRAAADTDTASDAVREAEAELARLTESIGCGDVADARAMRDAHRDVAASLTAARDRRREVLRGRDADEVRHEHARLAELAEQHAGSTDSTDSAEAPLDSAETAVNTARAEAEEAAQAVHDLALELVQLRTKPEHAKLVALEARVAGLTSTAQGARADLAAAREKSSDDAMSAARDAAVAASDRAAAEASAIAAEVEQADPKQAENLRDGARNRVDNLAKRYNTARDRRLQLESRVRSAEGEGEKLDAARSALEVARVGRDRLRRKADAAKLLHSTLVAHRDAARAKYAAPFAQSLQRYASQIFGPGTEFTLDDALRVQARTVGGTTVDLPQLSGGAKEQMALLTRFAIADMVAGGQSGQSPDTGVPVVVDDALGATDPQRLALMNALFSQVGENSQVFVLTCFPQRFDRVAAARSASIQELKTRR
ncbi:AAA family ATPase [Corynebacterium sp. P3-F1]|uniref:AAA family ATPase n=1 Tax=Corynebacterium sp. P3-F1 TaxID=3059080 RepID=UPI00265CEA04|nr:AAA family ATPase [Corynebacterium sp. P3-F1]WKK61321.1 AAA family ATPase [Corynebacterium sp. P3-F1]